MRAIKAILNSIIYIISAFIASVIITISFFFIKPFFEFPPSKQTLQLSEIMVRSKEVVTNYWQQYQQCPTDQALSSLRQLALIEQITMTSILDQKQCVLIIELDKQYFNNKKIKLSFQFNEIKEPSVYLFTCYTNAALKNVPISCGSFRDIDAFNSKSKIKNSSLK